MHSDEKLVQKAQMYPLVRTKDPGAVRAEVQRVYLRLYPPGSREFIDLLFDAVIACFEGRYADYQAIDARYHDFEHTLQGTLCLVRLLEGWRMAKAPPELNQRTFELALTAILLHDTGYLKKRDDCSGTGAKYTLTHVSRSAVFAAEFLGGKGFQPEEIAAIQNMIRCTGVNVDLDAIVFSSHLERLAGYAMGTADLLGQMAADDYIDKLEILYSEFAESQQFNRLNPKAQILFSSADDLIRKTPAFWEKYVIPKIEGSFRGVYRFLNRPDPAGRNPYLEQIENNISRLRQRIEGRPSVRVTTNQTS